MREKLQFQKSKRKVRKMKENSKSSVHMKEGLTLEQAEKRMANSTTCGENLKFVLAGIHLNDKSVGDY